MKRYLLFVICLIASSNVQAQNTAYANRMQHIFGNIDQTKVTTGYLKEFGVRLANIEACNGSLSNDNFVTQNEWQKLYGSLYSMRVGAVANNMTAPQTVNAQLETQQNNTNHILFAVQHYNYQQYKTNAYTNGDVTISNDRIFDVAGRNPYDTKTLFAVTPLKQHLQGNTFVFRLPSTLVYTNTGLSVSTVQIDFDNGQGYQTVTIDGRKTISYTSGGEKEIKVKILFGNGTTLYSHSKILLNFIPSATKSQARSNGAGFLNQNNTLWFNNPVSGAPWSGSSATGRVTIRLAPGHGQLIKPLIIIEGFDPENSFDYFNLILDPDNGGLNVIIDPAANLTLNQAIENESYDLVFVDFVNSTDFIQRNAYMVEEVIRQINQLKAVSGSTEKNVVLGMSMGGLVGRYALRHMEIEGETHDTKLYVSHDTPHQGANVPLAAQALVRHLVGEQVSLPVFLSLFNINLFDFDDNFSELGEGLALLQSPAAKQMLIYQLQGTGDGVSVDNSTLHHSFLTEYKNMGYPQQDGIRNIAIANGTECGTPLNFNAYDDIVNANLNVDISAFNAILAFVNALSINPLKAISSALSTDTDLRAQFTLRALPSQRSGRVYRGRVFIKKTILFLITVHEDLIDEENVYSTSNMLALDNANGGIYDIDNFAPLPAELEQYVLQERFNFIPIYSSLDVGSGHVTITPGDLTAEYNPTAPPQAPNSIPFDNFFTNPINSVDHLLFTKNNGQWLRSELAGSPQILSCAFACASNLVISGVNQFCTGSQTFSAPVGADTYQWQLFTDPIPLTDTPLNGNVHVTSATNTNSITIAHTGNRSGWYNLRVVINSAHCNLQNIALIKRVYVGAPTVSSISVSQDPSGAHFSPNATPQSCEVPLRLDFEPAYSGVTDIEWEKITTDVDWSRDYLNYPGRHVYLFPTCNKAFKFRVRAKNSCGFWSPWRELTYTITECSTTCQTPGGNLVSDNFIIYPVPANNVLNLGVVHNPTWNFPSLSPFTNPNNPNPNPGTVTYPKVTLNVAFYNNLGNQVHSTVVQGLPNQIDVSSLPPGNYIMTIQYLGQIETHNIQIN